MKETKIIFICFIIAILIILFLCLYLYVLGKEYEKLKSKYIKLLDDLTSNETVNNLHKRITELNNEVDFLKVMLECYQREKQGECDDEWN